MGFCDLHRGFAHAGTGDRGSCSIGIYVSRVFISVGRGACELYSSILFWDGWDVDVVKEWYSLAYIAHIAHMLALC